MKTCIKKLFLLPALLAGLGLILNGRVTAQTFTILHNFTATDPDTGTNSDGAHPLAGLILSGNTLYGTAIAGGSSNPGTVFKINTDGTGFTTLHSFTGGGDGIAPFAGLILSGGTLFGTAYYGGSLGQGTVFKVNTDGTGFTNFYHFTGGSDGGDPRGVLLLLGNTVYGTTSDFQGGPGNGVVFKVNTDGTGFTNLHSFTAGTGSWPDTTNSDGAYPYAGLILSGNTLYGTANGGGSSGNGTVFALNPDGTSFTNLHNFMGVSDGAHPGYGDLILSGNTLYGTARSGGSADNGVVFAVNTDGTGFTNLHTFTATSGSSPSTNSDGANPYAGLILSGHTLYGTARNGGGAGNGTVFAVNTNGTGFTTLYGFTASPDNTNRDGATPYAGLILSGNTLYGTAFNGGSSGNGTVFSLSFAPQLTIMPAGANVVLTWPTNVAGFTYAGFTLQSTTNLVSPSFWTAVSPGPVIVNGQNAVTNPISGTRKFYRLSQ
jgi:uncharacterized repeat protein (TIGR03803 family)